MKQARHPHRKQLQLQEKKQLPHLKRRLQSQCNTESDTTGKNYIGLAEETFNVTWYATQTFFLEHKLFKQHGTIKTYLDTQRQQHQCYN